MNEGERKRLRAAVLRREAQHEEAETMQDTMTVDAVADIGNATAIVAVVANGKADIWRVPTAKADMTLELPAKLASDDTVIAYSDGVPVALGWSALRYSDTPTAGRSDAGRYGAFTLDFVLAGIATKVKAERVTVKTLIVTVPAELVDQVRDGLIKAVKGTHRFTMDGREIVITLAKVRVEAEAAVALNSIKANGRTILIDGGGGTTQLAMTDAAGRFMTARTRGTGLQRALDVVSDRLKTTHGRGLTMMERTQVEQAMIAGEPYRIRTESGLLDVISLVRSVLDRVAGTIIADIKERIPAWKMADQIVLVGGQAYHLRAAYEAAFPGITIPKQPEYANVRGALALLNASEEVS